MRRTNFFPLILIVLLLAAGCGGLPQTAVNPGQIVVTVSPSAPNVSIFGTQQFNVSVTGTTITAVSWQVNGVAGGSQATGFISSTGLFVAPSGVPTKSDGKGGNGPTTVTIKAVSQASATATGTATVTILATQNQNTQNGPIFLGTSGGNKTDSAGGKCCSGTLGAMVIRNGTKYILSNNHVLGKSDFGTGGGPATGDSITQPGLVETHCQVAGLATVANLSEFYNLQTGSLPKVDAAIAQIVNGSVDASGNILLLGSTQTNGVPDPGGPVAGGGIAAAVAMNVAKSGRTTGLTCSSVIGINVTSTVDYTQNCDGTGTKFTVTFNDLVQVQGGTFSSGGDSGSLIVQTETAQPVALLFAGSDTDTVGNAISDVLNFFTANGGSATTTFAGAAAPHAVIGCTLPTKPASAVQALSETALAGAALQKAVTVREARGPELLGHPEVQAVGVGASFDNPAEAAILLFVTKGQPRTGLPLQVDGVRTRIIEGELFAHRGALNADESAELERSAPAPQVAYPISDAEVARAKVVQTAHVDELMKKSGVQGVGITSSMDSPGEAALMIVTIRGVPHDAIPPVIDGLRTRVRESSRFKAGQGDASRRATCVVPATKPKKQDSAKAGGTPKS